MCLPFCYVTAVQVYLRAGWSLGNTQDRYIFAGPGGGQLVGRALCGLPINGKEFSVLPPHFTLEDMAVLNEVVWSNILEGFDDYPAGFRRVVPYLFASLVFHEDFLRNELCEHHPLWNQRIFIKKQWINGYGNDERSCHYRHCDNPLMMATGIPSHLAIAHELGELKTELRELKESHAHDVQHGVQTLKSIMSELPLKLKETLLENFTVDGVAPVNMADMERLVATNNEIIMLRLEEAVAALSRSVAQDASAENFQLEENSTMQSDFQTFYWGGKFHYVPQEFRFPSTDVKTMWNLWHHGHAGMRVQPYKNFRLGPASDLQTHQERVNFK